MSSRTLLSVTVGLLLGLAAVALTETGRQPGITGQIQPPDQGPAGGPAPGEGQTAGFCCEEKGKSCTENVTASNCREKGGTYSESRSVCDLHCLGQGAGPPASTDLGISEGCACFDGAFYCDIHVPNRGGDTIPAQRNVTRFTGDGRITGQMMTPRRYAADHKTIIGDGSATVTGNRAVFESGGPIGQDQKFAAWPLFEPGETPGTRFTGSDGQHSVDENPLDNLRVTRLSRECNSKTASPEGPICKSDSLLYMMVVGDKEEKAQWADVTDTLHDCLIPQTVTTLEPSGCKVVGRDIECPKLPIGSGPMMISFMVKPSPGCPIGTVIANTATAVFNDGRSFTTDKTENRFCPCDDKENCGGKGSSSGGSSASSGQSSGGSSEQSGSSRSSAASDSSGGSQSSGGSAESEGRSDPSVSSGASSSGQSSSEGSESSGQSGSSTSDASSLSSGASQSSLPSRATSTPSTSSVSRSSSFTAILPPLPPPVPVCGDCALSPGETCEDCNFRSGDGCSSRCQLEDLTLGQRCGDGIAVRGEHCDDGNTVDGDGCSSLCRLEGERTEVAFSPLCGNGVLDAREECDEGPGNSNRPDAACRANCTINRCGNGQLDGGEQCDDGNHEEGDGCDAFCRLEDVRPAPSRPLTAPPGTRVGTRIAGGQFIPFPGFAGPLPAQLIPFAPDGRSYGALQPPPLGAPAYVRMTQQQPLAGETGPGALVAIAAGAAAGFGWVCRRRRRK